VNASDRAPLLVAEWLAQRAELMPRRPAVIFESETWTFRELDQRVAAAAERLAAAGVSAGQRVALLAANGSRFVLAVHAVTRLGAALVPLNLRLTASELSWQLRDAAPVLLLYDEANASVAAALCSEDSGLRCLPVAHIAGPPDASTRHTGSVPRVDLNAVHTIIYTSGTSGRPKGAMLTWGNHWWSAVGSALNLGVHMDDCWLACMPLFHVGGLAILLRGVIYGIPVMVHRSFDPAAVNRAIDEGGVTQVSVVAAMLHRMLDDRGGRPYPSTLRTVLLGGGPAPRSLLEDAARLGVPVVPTYGLTEAASQVATLAPSDARSRLGSAGKPLLPTEVRIVCEGRLASPGEIGEIVVRGPTVMAGYLNAPEATQAVLRDGWLHTGDVGYLDGDGYLYVVDRRDDLIISGGENVYPAEVEAVIASHPAVLEAGVTAVADRRWGQTVAATVVLRPGMVASADDLMQFCRQRLAGYKVPVRWQFRRALPRNAAGKLLRRVLREEWAEGER